jgi:hypothetical protein
MDSATRWRELGKQLDQTLDDNVGFGNDVERGAEGGDIGSHIVQGCVSSSAGWTEGNSHVLAQHLRTHHQPRACDPVALESAFCNWLQR